MTDRYTRFASCVQALRLRADALTVCLGGALGVGADPYPHQLASVRRILTDVRIRHLIADEVGLGKTVQSLMIVNALRYQNPVHKTVVVCPERLIGQWQQESWSRGHVVAAIPETVTSDSPDVPSMWLVRPDALRGDGFQISASQHDLLIIDEPQLIPLEILDSLVLKSREFRQVLVLSATPKLNDPRMREIVMGLLEPQRVAIARYSNSSADDFLAAREAEANASFSALGLSGQLIAFATGNRHRRVLRSMRTDWRQYLPERRVSHISIDPIYVEQERFDLARSLLKAGVRKDLNSYPVTAVRMLHRSRTSAREALVEVRKYDAPRASFATGLAARVTADPGDTRFEALLDVLCSLWAADQTAKALVVAGDARSIDMLRSALPRYFPVLGEEGAITALRRPSRSSDDTSAGVEEMHNAVSPFVSGRARVLLIADWVQAGLNLHHACSNIIFYSLPWDIDSVDQLIGRIDRIRNDGLTKGDRRDHGQDVQVWVLSARGSPEESVAGGMSVLGVFNSPLAPLTDAEVADVQSSLISLAENPADASAFATLRSFSEARSSDFTRLNERTRAFYGAGKALAAYEKWKRTALVQPALCVEHLNESLARRREYALAGWLKLIEKSEDFHIVARPDRELKGLKFRTIWYQKKSVGYPFELAGAGTTRWMDDHVPFHCKRKAMGSPPRSVVHTDDGETGGRALHFFDHGDSVLDSLVSGYTQIGEQEFSALDPSRVVVVRLPEGHPALTVAGKTVLLTAAYADPSQALRVEPSIFSQLSSLAASATTGAQEESAELLLQLYDDMISSDVRWVRGWSDASLLCSGVIWDGTGWQDVAADTLPDLFKPVGYSRENEPLPRASEMGSGILPRIIAEKIVDRRRALAARASASWSAEVQKNTENFELRRLCISAEFDDLIREKILEREDVTATIALKNIQKSRIDSCNRQIEMLTVMKKGRLNALSGVQERMRRTELQHCWSLLARFTALTE